MATRYQDHHMIPISLIGWDIRENIIRMSAKDHVLVHQKLNISYNQIRNFRRRNNNKFVRDVEFFVELRRVHLSYFSNLNKLPKYLIVKHANKVKSLCMYVNNMYNIGQDFGRTNHLKPLTKFNYFLKMYHLMMIKIAKRYEESEDSP